MLLIIAYVIIIKSVYFTCIAATVGELAAGSGLNGLEPLEKLSTDPQPQAGNPGAFFPFPGKPPCIPSIQIPVYGTVGK